MNDFNKLKKIIDTLRSPDGCPWDKKQNHESLLPFLLEESNEVIDAILKKDHNHLKEELGDLLLQILLHAKIAEENELFSINDVINDISTKLIRRHPHVFSNKNVKNSDEVIELWEKIKIQEKKKKNKKILENIPKNFPPLLTSYKLQKAASKVGFDWDNYNGVLDKIDEELEELKDAINNKSNIEHEIGDMFFALVNLSRFLKISPEISLIKANKRFTERFEYIEKKIKNMKKSFKDFNIEKLEEFWIEAKKYIKAKENKNG